MKIFKFLSSIIASVFLIVVLFCFELNDWPVGGSLSGILLGLLLPKAWSLFQDLTDTIDWKSSQRKLERGGFIDKATLVRISFAYLFRIKIGNKYLLVKNERGTGKFQPVGGVYKFTEHEKITLKNQFHVVDDDKISIDASSRNDYRLRLENRFLRKFIHRFDKKAKREDIRDLGREFKEELVSTGILNWNQVRYRYCGRHMTELRFEEHFQIYEILLADIVEVLPSDPQKKDLENLLKTRTNNIYFASAEEIKSLGINIRTGQLVETIGDHTNKILQENESQLMRIKNVGKEYIVNLDI